MVSASHCMVSLVSHQEKVSEDNYKGIWTKFPSEKQVNKQNQHTQSGNVHRRYAHIRQPTGFVHVMMKWMPLHSLRKCSGQVNRQKGKQYITDLTTKTVLPIRQAQVPLYKLSPFREILALKTIIHRS